jgi:hypothetical protein
MSRLPNVLAAEIVACQKTLEQKISDQGPTPLRVDPHLLGLGLRELTVERGIFTTYTHEKTGPTSWYANAGTPKEAINAKLNEVAPLYAQVASGSFPNLVGDALEIVVQRSLTELRTAHPNFDFLGSFDLATDKNKQGRFVKVEPPAVLSGKKCARIPDFFLTGFPFGTLSIECKNLREWIYPHHRLIADLIAKSIETDTIPCLVARRIHYTTLTNFFVPAGILAHESYYQYYPSDHADLAAAVQQKRSLGFSDVRATEEPHPRTVKFFSGNLIKVAPAMAEKFRKNRDALAAYVNDEINLAQLYNEIDSPAKGNWTDLKDIPF